MVQDRTLLDFLEGRGLLLRLLLAGRHVQRRHQPITPRQARVAMQQHRGVVASLASLRADPRTPIIYNIAHDIFKTFRNLSKTALEESFQEPLKGPQNRTVEFPCPGLLQTPYSCHSIFVATLAHAHLQTQNTMTLALLSMVSVCATCVRSRSNLMTAGQQCYSCT